MPPTKTPSRVAAGKPPGGRRPPADGRPGGGGSRFGGAFSRFGGGRAPAKSRGSVVTLVRDVRSELRKVEWPSRDELTKLTAAIVGLSATVGLFLGGVDFLFQELFKLIISLGNGGV